MTRTSRLLKHLMTYLLFLMPYVPLVLILLSRFLAYRSLSACTLQHAIVVVSAVVFMKINACLLMIIGIVLMSQMQADQQRYMLMHGIVGYTLSFVSLVC